MIANSNAPRYNRETEKQFVAEFKPRCATNGNNLLERVAVLLLALRVKMPQGEPPRLASPR